MKNITLALLFLAAFPAFAADERVELNDIVCVHYDDPNQDARLGISFEKTDGDFTQVTISKRMTDSGESWQVIHRGSEQVASSPSSFSIGIDDISIEIERPIPGWNRSKKSNGTLELRLTGESYALICENIKK